MIGLHDTKNACILFKLYANKRELRITILNFENVIFNYRTISIILLVILLLKRTNLHIVFVDGIGRFLLRVS